MAEYRLLYSETSRNQIKNLHPEIKPIIRSRLDRLQKKPFSGKRLEKELSGYRSLRARRFRIIYKLNEETKTIEIHYVGHRKDIYELFSGRIKAKAARGAAAI
jgi:mRNA interferase RelE/StbE